MAEQYKVELMRRAIRDLDNIHRYIAEVLLEPEIALKLSEEIENEILTLEQFPNRCAACKTGMYADKGYRQLFVKKYTVIFRVDELEKTVTVITVRYSASQF